MIKYFQRYPLVMSEVSLGPQSSLPVINPSTALQLAMLQSCINCGYDYCGCWR